MKVITFRSTPDNFIKEKDGRKNNTVRIMKDWDFARIKKLVDASHIEIRNTEDMCESFIRRISDKTVYNGIAIISWFDESNGDI